MACVGSMALYLLASESSCGRSALTLRVRAQKHGSESVITRLAYPAMLKHPGLHIITRSTLDYISGIAGVQGWRWLHQPYKGAGLRFGGGQVTKRERGIGQLAGP